MAITAACTINTATAKAEQKRVVTVTVTNGNATTATVTSIHPKVMPTGSGSRHVSVSVGKSPILANMTATVAGSSGTRAFSYDVVPHAPQAGGGLAEAASTVYDCGATVYTSDGSVVEADVVTLTVTPPSHT